MTETQTPAETAGYARAFWPSDYRRMAREIQRLRHVRCDAYTLKDQASQAKVDQLATAVAELFAADVKGFSPAVFLAGTQLPQSEAEPASYTDGDETDDDETGDETGDESDAEGGLLP